MVPNNLSIVCYTGGTCGDLITAMIDSRDVKLENKVIIHTTDRQRLKKPHLFANDEEKNQFLINVAYQYNSIPSHDFTYHMSQSHDFISIVVSDIKTAEWAATRFKKLHRPHVWAEMSKASNANTVDEYAQLLIDYSNMVCNHNNKYVTLEDIRKGKVIDKLEELLQTDLSKGGKYIYKNWLYSQMNL